MVKARHFLLIALLLTTSGCNICCCGKRANEMNCPTDIRQMQCWCFGEDAIFCCPCGPDGEFYGYQPTCWRGWPASGSEWRDARCPAPPNQEPPRAEPGRQRPGVNPPNVSSGPSFDAPPNQSNPFRGEYPKVATERAADFVGDF